MKEKENQTPRKELTRSSDLVHRRSKDSPANKTSKKSTQKNLAEVFIFEDVLPQISEESIDFSSISANSDANHNGETGESSVFASCASLSTSLEPYTQSELTPCSKMSTANTDDQIGFPKTGSTELEFIVNLLEQARLQALNSIDMEGKSKKVLDALIKFTINEFYTLPQTQERDLLLEIVSRNAYAGFLCLVLSVVTVSLFTFYYSRVDGSSDGPPPT